MNVQELKIEKQKLQDRITRIQEACSHPEDCVEKLHRSSDEGHCGIGHTRYWTDMYCELCENCWEEEGSL